MAEMSPWSFLLVSILATALPRALGTVAAGRVDPSSRVFEWVTAIAYAMAMGLAVRLLLLPTGPLADTPIVDRLLAAGGSACGFLFDAATLLVWFCGRRGGLLGGSILADWVE